MTQVVESICVFGSHARRSSDVISDGDLLIISSNDHQLDRLSSEWSAKGWSVAAYSPDRFLRICGEGSLFVQHIKQEAIFLQDDGRWLASTLETYRPCPYYSTERDDAKWMIFALLRASPTLDSRYCDADILFSLFRNAAIYMCASEGRYEFDYANLVSELSSRFGLCTSEQEALLSLRQLKWEYRQRLAGRFRISAVAVAREIAINFFAQEPIGAVDETSPLRLLGAGYATLRDVEKKLVAYYSTRELDGQIGHPEIDQIWQNVLQPSGYPRKFSQISCAQLRDIDCVLASKGRVIA
ncbi:hypothetical protein NKJ73_00125 [Mesorhizobium sp. M0074]|uniref:hypothetical protein n=1 Tax=Mesorhizobium sp. M0074 TaxID=2956869 RepID=UPI0033361D0A